MTATASLSWICHGDQAAQQLKAVVEKADSAQMEVKKAGAPACLKCEAPKPAAKKKVKRPPLFESTAVLEVTFQSNFPAVNVPGADQRVLHPGMLSYSDGNQTVTLPIQLGARGGGRASWCKFAPMKLVLPEGPEKVEGSVFKYSRKSLKLVTHCDSVEYVPDDGDWSKVVMTEYALYQILRASGLPALDTRLARATYLDPSGKKVNEGYLFFIEDVGDYAQRTGTLEVKSPSAVDPKGQVPFDLGLELIASAADHFFGGSKNAAFVSSNKGSGKNPKRLQGAPATTQIPYDFVLNPSLFPYSERGGSTHPVGWLKQYEATRPDLKLAIRAWAQRIQSNREKVRKVIDAVPFPPGAKQKQRILARVNEFYADIAQYLK